MRKSYSQHLREVAIKQEHLQDVFEYISQKFFGDTGAYAAHALRCFACMVAMPISLTFPKVLRPSQKKHLQLKWVFQTPLWIS